jgi:hypothetical protein
MIARVTLPSGRTVIDTGKLYIGIAADEYRPPEQGEHARIFQRLLTTPLPPREWHPTPPVIDLKPSLRKRVAQLLRSFR